MHRETATNTHFIAFLTAAILITCIINGCSAAHAPQSGAVAPPETVAVALSQPRPTNTATPQPIKTLTSLPSATPSALPIFEPNPGTTLYTAQPGDTLAVVARRYRVVPGEITSSEIITPQTLIKNGQELIIPDALSEVEIGPSALLLPDTEIVYSKSTLDFDVDDYTQAAGGYLSTYREYLKLSGWHTGAEIVTRVAFENAVNPRLLIALLEFQSGWISRMSVDDESLAFPLQYSDPNETGLYNQLTWAAGQIAQGYYGWREGTLLEVNFHDETGLRLAPNLNAGTVALQVLFSKLYSPQDWEGALYGKEGFKSRYEQLFGDYTERDQLYGPLFTHELTQPDLQFPFQPDIPWNFTSGPHPPWRLTGALAALDFAPSGTIDCEPNNQWVTAVASGLVIRSGNGIVVLDLDKDGHQQTGWVVVYIHLASKDRVDADTLVSTGSPIGHPSCEGGLSTGSHVHITRMYNGEWMPAGGPVPFELSGWVAHNGDEPYQGYLTKGSQMITANRFSTHESQIIWSPPEPSANNENDALNP